MPTAPFSTDSTGSTGSIGTRAWEATTDVGHLLRFRAAGLRGASSTTAAAGLLLVGLVTALAGWLPAYLPGAGESGWSRDVLVLLPSGYLGVLVVSVVSAVASGGGRELLPREQAVAFPVSPTTDHLGALVMAPLNISWLLQGWMLLAATAYVVGGTWALGSAQVPVLMWLFTSTAFGQLAAWSVEWLRRAPYGLHAIRGLATVASAAVTLLVVSGRLVPLLDGSPTVRIVAASVAPSRGDWIEWWAVAGILLAVATTVLVLGAVVANAATRRPARDEARVESSMHPPRPSPGSDLAALVRVDRAGVWRSVPLRRGMLVLATLPGAVSLAGALEWEFLNVLPGLVASGGALLFGVNSWCLDGRGALWRDSLPVSPRLVFASRVLVLLEVLLLATCLTLALAMGRAGMPTESQLAAVLCAAVVVNVQVVATALAWSVHRPFSVDMRSARATPAPPLVMVGYSTRLALSTTLTGVAFTVAAQSPDWRWPVLLAVPFLLFSLVKLRRTATQWADPRTRSRVVTTVAG